MAVLLFRWVCEAYQYPAIAANVVTVFPQLESIQNLLREFEQGAVFVSYTALLAEVAQVTSTGHTSGESIFGSPVNVTIGDTAAISHFQQPLEQGVHTSWNSAIPGAFVLEKTHLVTRWNNCLSCWSHLAPFYWFQETLPNVVSIAHAG